MTVLLLLKCRWFRRLPCDSYWEKMCLHKQKKCLTAVPVLVCVFVCYLVLLCENLFKFVRQTDFISVAYYRWTMKATLGKLHYESYTWKATFAINMYGA